MKIKFFLTIIFFIITINSFSQNNLKLNCDLYSKIVSKNYLILDTLNLKLTSRDTLFFVDTFNLFDRCNEDNKNDYCLIYTDKIIEEIKKGDASYSNLINRKNFNAIVLQNVIIKGKNKYLLTFWSPRNNNVLEIIVNEKKREKIKILNLGIY